MRSSRSGPGYHAPSESRVARRKLVLALAVLLLVVAGWVVLRRYARHRAVNWATERGLALLARPQLPADTAAALDDWERETAARWRGAEDELILHLFTRCPLEDRRVRALLTRVAGVDYGNRPDDWQRWFAARQRLRRGEQPRVAPRQRIELTPRWKAPVGLTAWFSTIIPLDGQIYVASLGASFQDERDAADGIVRVDGRSGAAELLFAPPEGRERDVLGIAAGDDCLFAACRSGLIFCVGLDGTVRWRSRAADRLAGPPLSLDINRDATTDVVAVASDGKVVALSGHNGNTIWSVPPARGSPTRRDSLRELGAALAAGNVIDDSRRDLVVTLPNGDVRVLAVRNAEPRWKGTFPAGALAGPMVRAGQASAGPPALVADRSARVWALVRSAATLHAAPSFDLLTRDGDTLVAALRSLAGDEHASLLIACPTGAYSGRHAAVCALAPDGVRWRYSPGGAIWATPALADLNGNKDAELIVASIEAAEDGKALGVVTILSSDGHCLRRFTLPAPIECSPVAADVDGDGQLELLVADQAGWLHCFDTRQIVRVEWGLFGGDSHNTRNAENAFRYGQVPVGLQWRWKPE